VSHPLNSAFGECWYILRLMHPNMYITPSLFWLLGPYAADAAINLRLCVCLCVLMCAFAPTQRLLPGVTIYQAGIFSATLTSSHCDVRASQLTWLILLLCAFWNAILELERLNN
jgi:hypothetical protein